MDTLQQTMQWESSLFAVLVDTRCEWSNSHPIICDTWRIRWSFIWCMSCGWHLPWNEIILTHSLRMGFGWDWNGLWCDWKGLDPREDCVCVCAKRTIRRAHLLTHTCWISLPSQSRRIASYHHSQWNYKMDKNHFDVQSCTAYSYTSSNCVTVWTLHLRHGLFVRGVWWSTTKITHNQSSQW